VTGSSRCLEQVSRTEWGLPADKKQPNPTTQQRSPIAAVCEAGATPTVHIHTHPSPSEGTEHDASR
jgi:hypothetical protein